MAHSIPLADLFAELPVRRLHPAGDPAHWPFGRVDICAVVSDHRQVTPGALFVAIKGGSFDGHRVIGEAIERGAAAIVGQEADPGLGRPYIQLSESRRALAHLAAAYYGCPARKLVMIGVTGTDGKTTTANLIYEILRAAGVRAGMISTVNAVIGEQVLDTGFHVTTPDAPDVQRYLALMVESGLTHAVLETTSHGWAQYRVDACEFDLAVVTNITHEHLNDHGSFENYRAAKARLFQSLAETKLKPGGNPRLAILNKDDSSYPYLSEVCAGLAGVRQLAYSCQGSAALAAEEIAFDAAGLDFTFRWAGQAYPIHSRLVGRFNVSNCLAALGVTAAGLGLPPEAAQRGIGGLAGVPGRMELIALGQPFTAIVDFAHTPNALLNALQTVRQMTQGKVITVFGSAGLRDRQKRLLMAEVAVQQADISIFTAEDPRTESLEGILAEMASAAAGRGAVEGAQFWRVPDRGAALRMAVSLAQPGDLVIACGKGHEQSMCFGKTEYSWDDRIALRAALAELLQIPGPAMPYLPTQDGAEAGGQLPLKGAG